VLIEAYYVITSLNLIEIVC